MEFKVTYVRDGATQTAIVIALSIQQAYRLAQGQFSDAQIVSVVKA